jgi:FixJ family two-component response regulator
MHAYPYQQPGRAPRVLVVHADPRTADELQRAGLTPDLATDAQHARQLLHDAEYDVVAIHLPSSRSDALELARELADSETPARPVMLSRRPSIDLVTRAMRSGAVDLIRLPVDPEELASRLDQAAEHAERIRRRTRRVERLKRICRRLHASREEVSKQVEVLCSDLVSAYREIADQMGHASQTSEYAALVAGELDVESLLRSTLEYVLSKSGPTNAAVYLPTDVDEFALGAYVNYDLPKETADVLLDHLADTLAPAFAGEHDLLAFTERGELAERLGQAGEWIGDAGAIVFACQNEGETLAVATLFRDASDPFPKDLISQLRSVRDLFAVQLARVIAVHNRHKPKDAWPGFEIDDARDEDEHTDHNNDDWGLAA